MKYTTNFLQNQSRQGLFLITLFLTVIGVSREASAQEKTSALNVTLPATVNLEDVSIRGEVNKKGSLFRPRDRFSLDDRVQVRKDFRADIQENIRPKRND